MLPRAYTGDAVGHDPFFICRERPPNRGHRRTRMDGSDKKNGRVALYFHVSCEPRTNPELVGSSGGSPERGGSLRTAAPARQNFSASGCGSSSVKCRASWLRASARHACDSAHHAGICPTGG